MITCAACRRELDASFQGVFCPYCGQDIPNDDKAQAVVAAVAAPAGAPEFVLEMQRDKFVLNQRCLIKFRVRKQSSHKVDLQMDIAIERTSVEENLVAVPAAKMDRPALITYAFTPKAAGEFRLTSLKVLAASPDDPNERWVFHPADDVILLKVVPLDGGAAGGAVYNIRVDEMYGSNLKVDEHGRTVSTDHDWQPIELVLDETATQNLRRGSKPEVKPQPEAQPQSPPVPKATCPFCAEAIPPGAKVCPFCRSSLVKEAPPELPKQRPPEPPPPPALKAATNDYTVLAIVSLVATILTGVGFVLNIVFLVQATGEFKKTGVNPPGRKLLQIFFWIGIAYLVLCTTVGLIAWLADAGDPFAKAPAPGFQRYTHTDPSFTFDYPSGCQLNPTALAQGRQIAPWYIFVAHDTSLGTVVEAYHWSTLHSVEAATSELQTMFGRFGSLMTITSSNDTRVGSHAARKMDGTTQFANGAATSWQMTMVVTSQGVIGIYAGAPTFSYASQKAALDAVIQSIHVR